MMVNQLKEEIITDPKHSCHYRARNNWFSGVPNELFFQGDCMSLCFSHYTTINVSAIMYTSVYALLQIPVNYVLLQFNNNV